MARGQTRLSLPLLFLLSLPAFATETTVDSEEHVPFDLSAPTRLRLSFEDYSSSPTDDWLQAVTMTSFPPGSLIIRYDGLHGLVVKHARSQSRRLVRHAVKAGWYVQPEENWSRRGFYEQLDHHDWSDSGLNGSWWQRSWLESRPPEKGGAPAVPYVHTYGHENELRLGPFSITNTLKFRFDYIGFFELNPDPVSHEHGQKSAPFSLDVRAAHDAVFGTRVKFRLKPHIRLGLPQGGDWLSFLHGVSLRGSFEIHQRGHEVISGEIEVKWRQHDDVVVTLEVALVRW